MWRWMVLGFALLLAACTVPSSDPAEIQKTPFPVASATDTFSWFGKTADELGIGEENYGIYNEIVFSGDLFGHTVIGSAYTLTDFRDSSMPQRINQIFLTDRIGFLPGTEAGLTALYGEPYATDTEPYVESKGGVTDWQYYWTGEAVISLSHGAQSESYTLRCSVPNEIPEEIEKRLAGLTTDELGARTGVYFHLEPDDLSDLHIDPIAYEGYDAYLLTFMRDGVPYRVTLAKGGAALYDTLLSDSTEDTVRDYAAFRYRIGETGSAMLVEKNIFDDLWILETDGPVTEEALLSLEDFLIRHWLF